MKSKRLGVERSQAIAILDKRYSPAQAAALRPIVDAASSDAWSITFLPAERATVHLDMRLGADVWIIVHVTRAGAITEARVRDGRTSHHLRPGSSNWPEPVPKKREWPTVLAAWVQARTAQLSASALLHIQIVALSKDHQSAIESAREHQHAADTLRAQAQEFADAIAELKSQLTPEVNP